MVTETGQNDVPNDMRKAALTGFAMQILHLGGQSAPPCGTGLS